MNWCDGIMACVGGKSREIFWRCGFFLGGCVDLMAVMGCEMVGIGIGVDFLVGKFFGGDVFLGLKPHAPVSALPC